MVHFQKVAVTVLVILFGLGIYFYNDQNQTQNIDSNNDIEQEVPENPNQNSEEPVENPTDPILETPNELPTEPVACTMDAKICPDGSYVGRVAPNCAFAPCPTVSNIVCTQEMIDMPCADIYNPVCATLEVQCVTEPCNPIKQTVNNACEVCKLYNLVSFDVGSCEASR